MSSSNKLIEVIQGEEQLFNIDLTSQKTQRPFDLTGNTEIKVCFDSEGTVVQKTKTATEVTVVGSPLLGQISVTLLAADTTTLPFTKNGLIIVTVLFASSGPKKAKLKPAFTVAEDTCTT